MRRLLPAAFVALAALPAPAEAIDLTGTWRQTKHSTCTGLTADGEKVAIKNGDMLFGNLVLTQNGNELYYEIPAYFWYFEGFVHGEPGGDTGQGILARCRMDTPMGDPAVTHRITKVKTFPPNKQNVSGKMTTLYVYGGPDQTYSCTINWERTSVVDPLYEPCP
jgi:hypothetical protein